MDASGAYKIFPQALSFACSFPSPQLIMVKVSVAHMPKYIIVHDGKMLFQFTVYGCHVLLHFRNGKTYIKCKKTGLCSARM